MNTLGRSLIVSTVAAGLAVLTASPTSAAADVTGSVSSVAERAAELTTEEHGLLDALRAPGLDAAERTGLEARLRTVDARGAELLAQLDRLDVDLTQAIRMSLGPLGPRRAPGLPPELAIPAPAVYDAATTDLLRIAETPAAMTNTPAESSSPAFGLLAVAALSLLTLGAAALGSSLRRHPDADELAAMAWSDGLTGLANRRRLDADLAHHDAHEVPTAAIMVDIDHFKVINDTFGHAYGDDVLRRVGETLSRQVRFDDIVYRYGGEEFCILLPGATRADAGDVAERIVNAVRAVELPDGRNVTVSVGVAGTEHGDATAAVLRADQALYSAKEQGRDRAMSSDRPIGV